ncbi:hypothetical protein B1748_11335 [Paenibacillus sp. MY03]|uniref:sialidase family protein n=1 Tax=Paenibacillus sp. MY03 TaxID=302980 RepID=UPI000B3C7391|nr:sialidase family protein [Paenibacillus sp. MY03]OUS76678.1 hypothetical protein B1748_11335 [Paenibacillus sp. MY03]
MNRFDGIIRKKPDQPGVEEAYLPVRYLTSHCANLIELDQGDLLCVWFSGSAEGNPDTNIIMSRLPLGAAGWTEPIELSCDPDRSEQNPVLFQQPNGELWLMHTSNEPHNQTTSRVVRRISADRGHTWSDPEIMFDGPGFFLRHPVVIMDNGNWLLPAYYCKEEDEYAIVFISGDQGNTWTEHTIPEVSRRVQMSVVSLPDGSLFAMFRSRDSDRIYTSRSHDYGVTWTAPERSELPNNNSSMQVVRLINNHLALIYNPASLENNNFRWYEKNGQTLKKALRTPLTIAISQDEGETWPRKLDLQVADQEYWENEIGYSYPSILQSRDGAIHVAFTYLRKGIKYYKLDEGIIR